jgi:methylisocitrate lyase
VGARASRLAYLGVWTENQAALRVYEALRRDGTQKNVLDTMQTRDDLYEFLGYHGYEQKLDQLFASRKP